jgi:hypothetical protein
MGWLYVPGLEDSSSECELRPAGTTVWCATSSGTPTLRPLSWHGWRTRPWIGRLSGTILRPSTAALGVVSWIASLRGCRANPIRLPVSETETSMSARFGRSSCASSRRSSLPCSTSRTFRLSSNSADLFGPSFGAWVSNSRRRCYTPPQSSAPPTNGSGSLSLLPTPTAQSYGSNRGGAAGRVGEIRPSLETLMTALPTPRATDGNKGGPNQRGSKGDLMLTSLIMSLPTPLASDSRGSAGVEKTELPNVVMGLPTPLAAQRRVRGTNSEGGDVLDEVVRLLPTPTAMDCRSSGAAGYSTDSGRHSGMTLTDALVGAASAGRTGKLNPRLSEWLQGFPVGWMSCEPLEMQSFRMWLHQRGLR